MKIDNAAGVMLKKWLTSEDGQEALAEEAASEVEGRTAMLKQIADLKAALTRDLPGPLKAVDAAGKKVERAQEALAAAEDGLCQAKSAVQTLRQRTDTQVTRLEDQLRSGARSDIGEFVAYLTNLWDSERLKWRDTAPWHGDVLMPAQVRIEQIRAAREQAEKLFFEPDPAVAERELERLKGEISNPLGAVA